MDTANIVNNKKRLVQLGAEGRYEEALKLAEQMLVLLPKDIELRYALAQLQAQQGMIEPAIRSYMEVVSRPSPILLQALDHLVSLCLGNGYEKLALEPARHLASTHASSARAQYNLARCLLRLDHLLEARTCLEKTLSLDSSFLPAWHLLADVVLNLGEVRQAIEYFKKSSVLRGVPDSAEHWCLNYLSDVDEESVFESHKRFAKTLAPVSAPLSGPELPDSSEGLRIGLVSKDFCSHSVAWFLKAMLRNRLDSWDVTCYSIGSKVDEVTKELKSLSDGWVEAVSLDDEQLAKKIRDDRLHVLVDLVGYAGESRLSIFARRVAPVQVTYLGYPNTTGLEQMDYRLTDEWSDPEGMTDAFYTEKLIRLPGGFLCFEPHSDSPPVVSRREIASQGIVFGSFNVHHKISDAAFGCWIKVLNAIPNSSIVLKSRPLAEPAFCERMYRIFEQAGVGRSRVKLLGHTPGKLEHLSLYNEIDINLDTFPYNGTTTTCEALWQGVPTLTLAGNSHRSRVGCSILAQVGLQDWVAETPEDFVSIAKLKSKDPDGLATLRAEMRDRMQRSSLLDGVRFVTELDSAFRNMIEPLS